MAPSRPLLLYFGILPFTAVRQRPQQLALALTRFTDVLYVDPPFSVFGAAELRKLNTATGALPDGIRVLEARAVLPVSGYVPFVNALNGAWIGHRLRRDLAHENGRQPTAIVTSFPKQLHVLPWLPSVPVCYDIMDDYPLFFDRWQGAMLGRWHRQLVRRADVVTVSSRTLGERNQDGAKRIECITNGVGAEFVAACASAAASPEITAFPSPRFGYVGAIAPWFDFEAVERLAQAYPSGSVLLVGPTMTEVPALPPNVHLLGARPHASLPPLLRGFDVGLIPLRRLPMIECANQVKLYEYLAADLPVVATGFREMLPFASLVELCEAAADWPQAAARALRAPRTPDWAEKRHAVARQNLWSDKAAALWAALETAR